MDLGKREIVTKLYNILDERKAENIKVIDISGVSVMTDYFVIATAGNINHMKALSDYMEKSMHDFNVKLNHAEGRSANWILLDYGDIVIHLFDRESRAYYELDRIWSDGEVILGKVQQNKKESTKVDSFYQK